LTFVTAMWQYPVDIYVSVHKGFIFRKNDKQYQYFFSRNYFDIFDNIGRYCEIVTFMLGIYSAYTRPPVGGFTTTQYF